MMYPACVMHMHDASVLADKWQCDEAKPVCKRCRVHFSNIEKCDYDTTSKKYRAERKYEPVQIRPARSIQSLRPVQSQKVEPTDDNGGIDSELKAPPYTPHRTQQTLACGKVESADRSVTHWRGFHSCNCPCHASQGMYMSICNYELVLINPVLEYASMLSDALFGICRVCGNFPAWTTSIEQCCPIVSPEVLLRSRVDPFAVLPTKSSPSVDSLMYHCEFSFSSNRVLLFL